MKTILTLPVLSSLMLGLSCECKCAADLAQPPLLPVRADSRLQSTASAAERKEMSQPQVATTEGEKTYSSLDAPDPSSDKKSFAAGFLKFEDADLLAVLKVYQDISHRTVIHASSLPPAKITIQTETALNRREVLQALDTILAQNGITMIPLGAKFVKAVPTAQAPSEAVPVFELPAEQLPESSSYILYMVELKELIPREVVPVLPPLASMPNSIVAVDAKGLLLLRDRAINVRRMLEVLRRMEQIQTPPTDK